MNLVCIVALCSLVAMASAEDQRHFDIKQAPELFQKFIKDYERVYKDDEDRDTHYTAFVKNLKNINRLNEKDPYALYGINKFADYTEEETKTLFGFKPDKY